MKTKPFKTNQRAELTWEGVLPSEETTAASQKVLELVPARLKIKRILVPTDFSERSKKALKYAGEFAEQFGASVTLLHVVEPIVYPADTVYAPDNLQATSATLMQEAKKRLPLVTKAEIGSTIPVTPLVCTGSPWHEITTVARKRRIDLIIIATHGYTGLKHLFLGSTAERVVRHAPCPVLTVRECEHEFVRRKENFMTKGSI